MRAAALARWGDVLAFERHACARPPRPMLRGDSTHSHTSAGREPNPCALLLCVGGEMIDTLERVLCHLLQGPSAAPGASGIVVVVSDSGGASSELYQHFVTSSIYSPSSSSRPQTPFASHSVPRSSSRSSAAEKEARMASFSSSGGGGGGGVGASRGASGGRAGR